MAMTVITYAHFYFLYSVIFSLTGKGEHKIFLVSANRKSASSWVHSAIASSQILRCGSPQIRKFAMINLEITNPQKDCK
jgi:hypothetical protein